jgi:hypothetical protein
VGASVHLSARIEIINLVGRRFRAAAGKSVRSAGRGLPALPVSTRLFVIWIIPATASFRLIRPEACCKKVAGDGRPNIRQELARALAGGTIARFSLMFTAPP